ncbi:MAG TPA: SPFH domain-containing protein [Tepidisphaeraceae bacterium]
MASVSKFDFQCACGVSVRAKPEQAGMKYTCPSCGQHGRVPRVGVITNDISEQETPQDRLAALQVALRERMKVPSTFRELLTLLGLGYIGIAALCLILSFFGPGAAVIASLLFATTSIATAYQMWLLLHARQNVLIKKEVRLLWGMAKLVAWDPTEGVLILKNKSVTFADSDLQDGAGGVRFLYPILGEELALRVPLEVQTLSIRDENVLTREYLNLKVRATMKWQIVDVRKFYLLVSRELRTTGDHNDVIHQSTTTKSIPTGDVDAKSTVNRLLTAAIEWLRGLAEEQTRLVVSKVRSGLLIADRLATQVPGLGGLAAAPEEVGGATEGLSNSIYETISHRVSDFGIRVLDVSLQEVQLPPEIVQQCVEACKAAYLPLLAQREAARKQADLQVEVDLLGKENVGTTRIVQAAPAYALADFLQEFLKKQLPGVSPVGTGVAAAITQAAIAQPPQLSSPPPNG